MKNKALISFCINILVGLLFSFPVFSAEIVSNTSHSREVSISCNELCINNTADSNDKLKKEFPESFLEKSESAKKNVVAFSNNLPAHSSPPVKYFYNLYSDLASPFKKYLNPEFIDLSYYTELEVTKMLC